MLPERLNFLSEFDNFYNKLILDLKEDKYNEQEFYLIVAAKVKAMDRERREKLTRLNEKSKTVQAV
ncbi:hypothetical protein ES695_00860 [Candidatus Atribacteria bacterium 1244-E10-H5-B2]|jgi:hypothetical protein|nr:MAG: hypothetical protein ES695_11450 [Candidatus Atribacteria bacterium 1244-E10-H5-B2]RXG66919.1 MAG: hypothetical protein ES695_00860 [Candidatus Atribacteria bacterium 1244-E10-H5-B2]